jgi:drug/metabolite transporter (DMT)-like permease
MLQKLPPEINSIYAYVNPIVAVLLGRYFGETLTVAIGIGGLITLSGFIWSIIRSKKQAYSCWE